MCVIILISGNQMDSSAKTKTSSNIEFGSKTKIDVALYNIQEDPYEEINQLMEKQDVFRLLMRRLKEHCKTHVKYIEETIDVNAHPNNTKGLFQPFIQDDF